jgi:hypothetical protein
MGATAAIITPVPEQVLPELVDTITGDEFIAFEDLNTVKTEVLQTYIPTGRIRNRRIAARQSLGGYSVYVLSHGIEIAGAGRKKAGY